PIVELVDTQPPEGAQPVVLVVEPVRELEGRRQRRTSLAGAPLAVHQRPAECRRKLHPQSRGVRRTIVELCQRHLAALSTFAHQPHTTPPPTRHPAPAHKSPPPQKSQADPRAHFPHVPPVPRQPLGLRQRSVLRLDWNKYVSEVFGVATRCPPMLAGATQLFEG